ncbi:MAG: prepilin-type N-terminal cleavage/methylation domain-containing protein [Planctomycetota bacterium]
MNRKGFTLMELMIACMCIVIFFAAATEFMFALGNAAEYDAARYRSAYRSRRLVEMLQEDLREATSYIAGIEGNGFVIEVPAVDGDGRVIAGRDVISYSLDPSDRETLHRTVVPCAASARKETKTRAAILVRRFSVHVDAEQLATIELRVGADTRRGDVSKTYRTCVFMRNYQAR